MAYNAPFAPAGNTISLTTSGTGSTSQSRQVNASDFGRTSFPPQLRIVNRGASDVWVSFTSATATVAIPTPGTTTVGTPQPVIILLPGVVEVFSIAPSQNFWINDISTGISQTYHVLAGEGS